MSYPRSQLARSFKRTTRTAGDIVVSSTTWVDLSTLLDITLAAQVGDYIECGLNTYTTSVTALRTVVIDVVSVVAASPVNYWATAGGASDYGVQSWKIGPNGGPVGGSIWRALVAGDLSAGTVTLRLRTRIDASGSGTIKANANEPLFFFAQNLGPADPN